MFEGDLGIMLAALLAACAVGAIVFVLAYPYFSGDRQRDARYRALTEDRARVLGKGVDNAQIASRRKAVSDTLKELERRQKAVSKASLQLRLSRAGLKITPKVYWLASVVCGLTLAAIISWSLPPSGSKQLVVIAAALVGTFGVPRWFVAKLTTRRQGKFLAELPNAVDVVVRGVKSGLPLHECFTTIANESAEPLASEFREVVEQQRVGVPISEALERMTKRVPLAEVRFLMIVIAIQQQAGGNLSEALGNLSNVVRDRFRLKMKVKALSAEAKASAVVLASLPPVVMFMVYGSAPDYIEPLFATRTGNLMLIGSAIWMMIGVLVMRKMINFKF